MDSIDWGKLRAPFDPQEVDFRIQGNPQEGKTSARVVAYVDARTVQDRLDEVVGPLDWAFDWQPIITKGDVVMAAKGILTICGVSKADVGDPGNTEPSKACVSDSLKRAAVHWGIGRYLYELGAQYAEVKKFGNSWVLADGEVEKLRAKLGRKTTTAPQATPARPQEATGTPTPHVTTRTMTSPQPEGRIGATTQQLEQIRQMSEELGRDVPTNPMTWTDAASLQKELTVELSNKRRQSA